jgi:hypothetical protein
LGRVDPHIEWVRDTGKTLETVRRPCAAAGGLRWPDLAG